MIKAHPTVQDVNEQPRAYAESLFNDLFCNDVPDSTLIEELQMIESQYIIKCPNFFPYFTALYKTNKPNISPEDIARCVAVSYSYELVMLVMFFSSTKIDYKLFAKYLKKMNLTLTRPAYGHVLNNDYHSFEHVSLIDKITARKFVKESL